MAVTPILNITKWTAAQNQPDVTINAALDVIDGLAKAQVINFASDADRSLVFTGATPQEWQPLILYMTDTGVLLTTARNVVTIPRQKLYWFMNGTAQTLTLKTTAGTGIAIATNKMAILRCDGTNIVRVTPATMTFG